MMGLVHCETCGDPIDPEDETDYYDGKLHHRDCLKKNLEEKQSSYNFGESDDSGS